MKQTLWRYSSPGSTISFKQPFESNENSRKLKKPSPSYCRFRSLHTLSNKLNNDSSWFLVSLICRFSRPYLNSWKLIFPLYHFFTSRAYNCYIHSPERLWHLYVLFWQSAPNIINNRIQIFTLVSLFCSLSPFLRPLFMLSPIISRPLLT